MRFWFLVRLDCLSKRGDADALTEYRQVLDDPMEQELCNMALAMLRFARRDNLIAQGLFATSLGFFRERQVKGGHYLRLFCLVHLGLLRQNLEAAVLHARQGRVASTPVMLKRIFPIPDLEDRVLFKNTIEATG